MAVLVLAALADPVRREIVELLAAGEAGAGEIAERFPVTRPAVSRHLRVLREAGLVTSEVRAQRRVYRLQRAPLAELDAWLERFRPLPGGAAPRRRPCPPVSPTGSTRSTPRSGAAGAVAPPRMERPMTTEQQADDGSRLVVLRREYPDPIDDVWAALTESERHGALDRHVHRSRPRRAAASSSRMTGEVDAGGEVAPPVTVPIVECDPPRRLVLDIPEAETGPGASP